MSENGEKKTPKRVSLDERVSAEEERLRGLMGGRRLSPEREAMLEPVLVNTAWMKVKLDDARKTIRSGRVIIKYDNGGGQKGSHANPAYAEYRALWASYLKGVELLLEELPTVAANPDYNPGDNVLSLVLGEYSDDGRAAAAR